MTHLFTDRRNLHCESIVEHFVNKIKFQKCHRNMWFLESFEIAKIYQHVAHFSIKNRLELRNDDSFG